MKLSNLLQSKRLAKYVSTFGVAAAALLIGTASVSAQANCREIQGRYHEQAVAPADCTTSPVGLCITANYTNGPLHGTFTGSVNSLIQSSDTPTTTVLFFTTSTVIHAQIGHKQGDIFVKNNGAFQTAAPGAIMDIQYITGGNGGFVGASGVIQAFGKFDGATGMGDSEYVGTICLP